MKVQYVANDGKIFDNARKCYDYENSNKLLNQKICGVIREVKVTFKNIPFETIMDLTNITSDNIEEVLEENFCENFTDLNFCYTYCRQSSKQFKKWLMDKLNNHEDIECEVVIENRYSTKNSYIQGTYFERDDINLDELNFDDFDED